MQRPVLSEDADDLEKEYGCEQEQGTKVSLEGIVLGALGLADHFHFTPIAGETESWKMERKMFEHALGLAETARNRPCTWELNIFGTEKWGLTPVLIDPDVLFPEAECRVIERLGDLLS